MKLTAVWALFLAAVLSSCSTPKSVTYFQDIDTIVTEAQTKAASIKVQPEDKLMILVTSKDPEMSSIFNLSVASSRLGQVTHTYKRDGASLSANSTSDNMGYYTVNEAGNIEFPVLGSLHVAGMTRSELAGYIKGELAGRGLLKDAVVTIEYVNTGVNILGEVSSPGRYTINRDRLTILDALALAGDLTIQGQRENVLVIREENGKRSTYRLDLTNAQQVMNSPAYYLQQNDVVYVEPNSVRKRQTTVNGNNVLSASFWVSVASLLTSIAVLIVK
ncbi:MAG: polysaccharide export protein [Bacteroidales bacterium]|nr:polysaccharide export protein [Bacteroidales bacterium]MBD5222221.1 polysaccharide export protein [Bacteroidales bacterium]